MRAASILSSFEREALLRWGTVITAKACRGRFHHAGREAALPDGRRLLVAGDAADADRAAEQIGPRLAEVGSAIAHLRQQARPGRRTAAADPRSQAPRPISNSSVRDALVASVAWTLPPVSRQSRNESTVPKASRPCSAAARAPITLSSSQPILVAEKYGSSTQAGLVRDRRLMPGGAQRRAGVGGAPVLPDDGVMDRLAVDAIPDDRGFALVGDADAGDVLGADARPWPSPRARSRPRRPDFLRIVLDPSRRRIDLAQLLLRDGDRRKLVVEHDRPRRGGALIDGDEVGHLLRGREFGFGCRVTFERRRSLAEGEGLPSTT